MSQNVRLHDVGLYDAVSLVTFLLLHSNDQREPTFRHTVVLSQLWLTVCIKALHQDITIEPRFTPAFAFCNLQQNNINFKFNAFYRHQRKRLHHFVRLLRCLRVKGVFTRIYSSLNENLKLTKI